MATPITWQNIQGPDYSGATRSLDAAQRSFGGVFDQLGSVLAQHQRIGEANWQNTKTNNTNTFLDRLAAFKTPEELAAAQQAGVLNQLRQQFGAQIDTAAIRGAEEQRLNQLRAGVKQAGEYQDWSTDRAQFGDVEKAKQLIADKDFAGARALLGEKDLRQESVLWDALTKGQRAQVVEGQQDKRFENDQTRMVWDGQIQPLNLEAKRVDIAQGRQSINESRARVENMGEQTKSLKAAAAMAKLAGAQGDKAFQEEKQNGAYSLGAYGTKEGNDALYAGLKNIPGLDDRDKEDIIYNLQKYYKDGITVQGSDGKTAKVPLPVSAVLQAIEGSSDNLLAIGFSRRGDHVAELIAERFGLQAGATSDYKTPRRNYTERVDSDLVNSMLSYQSMLTQRQQRAQNTQQRASEALQRGAAAKKSQTR